MRVMVSSHCEEAQSRLEERRGEERSGGVEMIRQSIVTIRIDCIVIMIVANIKEYCSTPHYMQQNVAQSLLMSTGYFEIFCFAYSVSSHALRVCHCNLYTIVILILNIPSSLVLSYFTSQFNRTVGSRCQRFHNRLLDDDMIESSIFGSNFSMDKMSEMMRFNSVHRSSEVYRN
jgi:hypothetical protein